ncbi:MAG: hypothetical protein V1753_05120 [Pseudomonadota bacterium]
MIQFFLRRCFYGVTQRRAWLFLLFIPPLAYMLGAGLRVDRFTISQDISVALDAQIALGPTPEELVRLKDIIESPKMFFEVGFALKELSSRLSDGMPAEQFVGDLSRRIVVAVRNSLFMTSESNSIVRITYQGDDRDIGRSLVEYYSDRLIKKVSGAAKGGRSLPASSSGIAKASVIELLGSMRIVGERDFWRPDRLAPLLKISFCSLVGVLLLLCIFEWLDPSLKSERKAARYLGLPVLGSVPDLDKIAAVLGGKTNA